MLRILRNDRGIVLVVALMISLLMLTMWAAAAKLATLEMKKTSNFKGAVVALGRAEIGLMYGIKQLAFKGATSFDSSTILGNYSTGTITVTATADPDINFIQSEATWYTSKAVVRSTVEQTYPSFPGAKGAITANGPVGSNGELIIDGRNHDLNGVVIPGGGPGLITGGTYDQSGGSLVGGSFGGVDYSPSAPGDPNIIEEDVAGLALTPDSVVGMSEGRLLALAMSGLNGGQYVTDPSQLVPPLQGITYVDIPFDDPWIVSDNPILDGGTGILIVHNSTTNAIIKNMNAGTFKGLIIADDVIHVHTTVIGALVSLTPLPSDGNVIGNGSGSILYSEQALQGMNWITDIVQKDWIQLF